MDHFSILSTSQVVSIAVAMTAVIIWRVRSPLGLSEEVALVAEEVEVDEELFQDLDDEDSTVFRPNSTTDEGSMSSRCRSVSCFSSLAHALPDFSGMSTYLNFQNDAPLLLSDTQNCVRLWNLLRRRFPKAYAAVVLPDGGHLLVPDDHKVLSIAFKRAALPTYKYLDRTCFAVATFELHSLHGTFSI